MEIAVAVAAAVVAAASAGFAWLQVREMQAQTRLQREIAEGSAQPYIWADVRLQSANGWNLEFVVGNSGSTVATDVRAVADPPFSKEHEGKYVGVMHDRLARGLASLAPGRTLHWTLGPSPSLVNGEGSLAHNITIDCTGPFGAIETSRYVIDLADFRESVAEHTGIMHEVAKAIAEASNRLPDTSRPLRVQLEAD